MLASYVKSRLATFLLIILVCAAAHAQSGSSSSITGTVVDPPAPLYPAQLSRCAIQSAVFPELQSSEH
jgi:hypothetical protein